MKLGAGTTSLIAGGAGFLGSNLTERLLRLGGNVVVVDDCSTGSWTNLRPLTEEFPMQLSCINHDVRAPLFAALDQEGVATRIDVVCNLASPASPPAYMARPIETLQTGSIGTQNLLDLAVTHSARFLQASTSEIYGDPSVHPQPESYWGNVNSIGPRSCYDEAKRYGEALCAAFERERGLDLRLVRIFNTYGPRMQADDGRVVTNFIMQALAGEPLTIYGDGSQTRSFCYVDDLIEGFVRLLSSEHRGPMNLGSTDEFTMLELASVVRDLIDPNVTIEYRPLPIDDPRQRKPDISRATELLAWTPKISLAEGVSRTIEFFTAK
jgi:UDP-glucuronate decarboxylase